LLAGHNVVPNKLRCSLLCEDVEHERLFRPILERLFRRVRVEPCRREGGFTFVLARLADVARILRKKPDEAIGLLVALDADAAGFQRRYEDVMKALRQEGLAGNSLDRVAVCIPARNVETWELWLCGFRDLDQHTDFKSRFHHEVKPGLHPKQLVEAWFAELSAAQRQEEARILPALARGREEIKRLWKFSKP
jgi:hypothetical protein